MVGEANEAILALLREIRDLLIPISDEYRAGYEEREAVRRVIEEIIDTPERKRMYELMNGARTQMQIAEGAGVAQGTVSRFISDLADNDLVDMVRVGAAERPARKYDIHTGRRLGAGR